MTLDIPEAELTVVLANGLMYKYYFASLETAFDGKILLIKGLAASFDIIPENEDSPPIPDTSSGTNRQN